MKRLGTLALVLSAGVLASCASPAPTGPSGPDRTELLPPLDASVAVVSASAPGSGASAALDACSITDTSGQFGENGSLGLGIVVGMGLVGAARDVGRYVAIDAGELQNDLPAWVITTSGLVTLPLGPPMKDPTCVFVGDRPYWFATGGIQGADGTLTTPMPLPAPKLRLPPLGP